MTSAPLDIQLPLRQASRHALQAVIAIAGLVPVAAGLGGVLFGPGFATAHFGGEMAGPASLDSHFRYLSGLLLGLGLLFWGAIPSIERRGGLVRALTVMVVIGGLARLFSLTRAGAPELPMRLALIMELIVTPAVCLWQMRLARAVDGDAAGR